MSFCSLLCSSQQQPLLVDTLRELVASPLPSLRAETAHLLHLVVTSDSSLSGQEELVSRMLLPAMVSLASDPEVVVKLSAIPGLAGLLSLSFLQWEVKRDSEETFEIFTHLHSGKREDSYTAECLV